MRFWQDVWYCEDELYLYPLNVSAFKEVVVRSKSYLLISLEGHWVPFKSYFWKSKLQRRPFQVRY